MCEERNRLEEGSEPVPLILGASVCDELLPTVDDDIIDDRRALEAVARATGGTYYFAQDRESLAGIYDELDRLSTREVEVEPGRRRQQRVGEGIELGPAEVVRPRRRAGDRTSGRSDRSRSQAAPV